ncbi:MAG: Ig-like domain repeat protein [Solirubrobacteraceae bacterium]
MLATVALASSNLISNAAAATSTVTLACNPSSVMPSGSTSCTATVSGSLDTPPSGTVTFRITKSDYNGAAPTILGSCGLTPGMGSASCTLRFTVPGGPGSATLTATYGGEGSYTGSSGQSTLTVQAATMAPTKTSVSCSPNPVTEGSATTCTATVTGGSTPPTGAVSFTVYGSDGNPFAIGSCTLNQGQASSSCSVRYTPPSSGALSAGSDQLVASYDGSSQHSGSAGQITLVVSRSSQATSTTVSCAPNPVTEGSAATCTATVTGGSTPPTGTVSFTISSFVGATASPLGSCTLTQGQGSSSCAVHPASGPASGSGSEPVFAFYNGDPQHPTSFGQTTLVVQAPAVPQVPPTVQTGSASVSAGHPVVIAGTVDTHGDVGDEYFFQYGTSASSYGSETTRQSITSYGAGAQPASGQIFGPFIPGATYHYRIVGLNTSTTAYSYGQDRTFTASAAPPVAMTGVARPLGSHDFAVFLGQVDPGGTSTTYFFQYGTTTSYGFNTSNNVAGGSATVAVQEQSLGISGAPGGTYGQLQPNAIYHYRLVATSSAGTSYGMDRAFNTSPSAPTAHLLPEVVTQLLPTSATVKTTFTNPGNELDTYRYEYSTESSFQHPLSSAAQSLPAGGLTNVTDIITGLTPDSRYYVRVRIDGERGPLYSDNTFQVKTGNLARTEPASAVQSTTATLNGQLSSSGQDIKYYFVYGPQNGPTMQTPQADAGSPDGTTPVSADVSGLTAGVSYTFHLVTIVSGQPPEDTTPLAFDTLGGCAGGASGFVDHVSVPGSRFFVTGCFDGASGGQLATHGPYVSRGTLNLSGLTLVPSDRNGTLTIDPQQSSISSSEGESVDLGAIRLRSASQGPLSAAFDPQSNGFTLTQHGGGADLFGFPVGEQSTVTPNDPGDPHAAPKGSVVSLGVQLPSFLGGTLATAMVPVDSSGNPSSQVSISVLGQAFGAIQLPGFTLTHTAGNIWSGSFNFTIPLAGNGITGTITVAGDKLTAFGASFTSPPEIPLGDTGAFLSTLGGGVTVDPFSLTGTIGISAGPSIGKIAFLGVIASFSVGQDQDQTLPAGLPGVTPGTVLPKVPFTFTLNGNATIYGFVTLASAGVYVYDLPHPFIAVKASAGYNVGDCNAGVDIGGDVAGDGQGANFNIEGDIHARVTFLDCVTHGTLLNAQASAIFSNTGFGVCGQIGVFGHRLSIGVGQKWKGRLHFYTGLFGNDCSLEPYTTQIFVAQALAGPGAARAGSAAAPTLRFANHAHQGVVQLTGRGGPPLVNVSGPGGRTAQTVRGRSTLDRRSGILILPDPSDDTTTVAIVAPGGGRWSFALQPGSAAVSSVRSASSLPPAVVHARVTGQGHRRTLSWQAAAIRGQRLRFFEVGAGGRRLIIQTTRRSGRVRFTALDGRRGERSVEVQVMLRGQLRTVLHVARFAGPTPYVPSRVRGLSIAQRGRVVSVTWRRSAHAHLYRVALRTSSGQHATLQVRSTHVVLRGIMAGSEISVTVRGFSAGGIAGPPGHADLRSHRAYLTLRSAQVSVRRGVAAIALSCHGRCTSVVALYDKRAGHGGVRVGLRSLRLGFGRHVVAIKLNATGRSLLRRAGGRLPVALIDAVTGGAPSTTTVELVS